MRILRPHQPYQRETGESHNQDRQCSQDQFQFPPPYFREGIIVRFVLQGESHETKTVNGKPYRKADYQ
ncbi:MAG: hypothetical protein WCJ35_22915 [Planctomycetota bacterium]